MDHCTYCDKNVKFDLFPIKIFGQKDQQYCSFSCLCESKDASCNSCRKTIDFSSKKDRIRIKYDNQIKNYCSFHCVEKYSNIFYEKDSLYNLYKREHENADPKCKCGSTLIHGVRKSDNGDEYCCKTCWYK